MRGLSPEFLAALKPGGILSPITEMVQKDIDLIMEIRDDYIDIYYKGGRIFELKYQKNEYSVDFDIEYAKNHTKLPEVKEKLNANKIATQGDAEKWVDNIRFFKGIMDYHASISRKETYEKNIQQLIVQENNLIRSSKSTDYFIIDFEYQCTAVDTRFDLVGLFWDRKFRKKPKGCRLAIIEVKYGDKSLDDDENGLAAHIVKTKKFLEDKDRVKAFKEEMISIFRQKRELGILNIENPHEVPIEALEGTIELLIIIAGHNPGSSILKKEIDKVKKLKLKMDDVLFATSSFTGYALFKENVKPFEGFTLLDNTEDD